MKTDPSIKLGSLVRILNLIDNNAGKLTPAIIAHTLDVTERTVYRYMRSLQQAGYPIFFDRSDKSYRFVDGYSLRLKGQHPPISNAIDIKSKMLGALPLGQLAYDRHGQCILANEIVSQIFGRNQEYFLGTNFKDIEFWKTSGLLIATTSVAETGVEFSGDILFATRFRKDIWCHIIISRISWDEQNYLLILLQDITGRKKADLAAKENEEILHQFVKNTPSYAFIKNDQFQFVQLSDNYSKLFGLPIEDIIGKSLFDLLPLKVAQKKLEEDQLVLKTGRLLQVEETFLGKYFSTTKFSYEHNGKKYLAGYAVDLTDRYKAEQLAQEKANQFRLLSNSTLDAFWLVDNWGNFKDVNATACILSGYTKQELLKLNLKDIEAFESPQNVQDLIRRVKEKGYDRFETRHRRKDGRILDVEVSTASLAENGDFIFFVRDISEAKHAYRQLEQIRRSYNDILESFNGLIYLCSQDYKIEFMNRHAIAHAGRNAVGESCHLVMHGLGDVCPWCVNHRVFQGEIVTIEVQSPKDNRWYEVFNSPVYHADGTISKQAIVMDITEKKLMAPCHQ